MRRNIFVMSVVVFAAVSAACQKSAPLSPTAPAAATIVPADGSNLKSTAPVPQSPSNGLTLSDLNLSGVTMAATPATLTYATSSGLQYEFELLNGESVIERSGLLASPNWTQTRMLDYATRYTWRVRALRDDAVTAWSNSMSFSTRDLPPHFRCGPPFNFTPIPIIDCHLLAFNNLDHHEFVPLLRRVARDLNKAKYPGGPFGLLVKTTGNNCGGYSCDILCTQNGSDQDQFDMLLDETYPTWREVEGPTIRACELQGSEQIENDY